MVIYKCTFPNGKMYIGQTHNFKKRKREHLRLTKLKTGRSYDYPLYRAMRKYGVDSLVWEIIDYANTQEELNQKEKYWIKHYNTYIYNLSCNGYNMTIGGEGVNGLKHTNETKEHIRQSGIGEKNSNVKLTKETVLKIVELSKTKQYSQVELSKIFNTSEAQISRILSGSRWSSVTGIECLG